MQRILLICLFVMSLAAMGCGDSVPEDRNSDRSDQNTNVNGSGEGTGEPQQEVTGPNRIQFTMGSGTLESTSYRARIILTAQPAVQPAPTSTSANE